MSNKEEKRVGLAKLIAYSVVIIALIVCYILIPKKILSYNEIYNSIVSMAKVSQDELISYDYKVYSTSARFEAGLENDVPEVLAKFEMRGEALAIRIYGDSKSIEFNGQYWIVKDPNAIELNIEYYIVPNFKVGNNELPIRSAVLIVDGLIKKITTIYLCVATIGLIVSIIPPSIGIIRRIWLIKHIEPREHA